MNRRLRCSPPEQRLAQRPGTPVWPVGWAFGIEKARTCDPRRHAPAAPQIAVDVAAEAVRRSVRAGVDQHLAVGERAAVGGDVMDEDAARLRARLDDVELALVGRERES